MARSAPAAVAASSDCARPSRIKLTVVKLKEMKACRQEVKAKGLAGDDRRFYMQDCMTNVTCGSRCQRGREVPLGFAPAE